MKKKTLLISYILNLVDQLLDYEDVLDFIQRAQQILKNSKEDQLTIQNSPSIVPTIPVGILTSTVSTKKTGEKTKNLETKKGNTTPITINKIGNKYKLINSEVFFSIFCIVVRQEEIFQENAISSSLKNNWVQINNICVPYIIKSTQIRLLPYQVLLDCDLFNEQEQSFLQHFTIKANSNDIQTFERIISSSSSIEFTLNNDLLLIDLYHLIFGMSKVVYVKLLNNQRDVNKSYKTYDKILQKKKKVFF